MWVHPWVWRAAYALAGHELETRELNNRWKREREFARVIRWFKQRYHPIESHNGYYKVAFTLRVNNDVWCVKRVMWGILDHDAEGILWLPPKHVPATVYLGNGGMIQEYCPADVERYTLYQSRIETLGRSLGIGDLTVSNVGWRGGVPVFIDLSRYQPRWKWERGRVVYRTELEPQRADRPRPFESGRSRD